MSKYGYKKMPKGYHSVANEVKNLKSRFHTGGHGRGTLRYRRRHR